MMNRSGSTRVLVVNDMSEEVMEGCNPFFFDGMHATGAR